MLDKLVILSSVSSVEGLPSPETSQGNDLRADDLTDDLDTTDDISIADVRPKADDTDDKNSRSTSCLPLNNRLRRF